jgi:transcriptional regulator with XRE-family HTH domain
MPATTHADPQGHSLSQGPSFGAFLRGRRARLSPGANAPGASSTGRRRTPGLRREEVAARAGVSVTWYTWLEQGRGGPPSAEVLERLARALELDAAGREMLFLLAQQRPPPLRQGASSRPPEATAALQRVLDAMPASPALVKTPTWDIVAWNAAAMALMGAGDEAQMNGRPNSLRRLFLEPAMRASLPDWEHNARFMLAAFRMDVARIGGSPEADALIAELAAASPDFARLWAEEADVRSHGVGQKRFLHPIAGALTLEVTTFAVDSAAGLTMMVFTPTTAADVRALELLLARQAKAA